MRFFAILIYLPVLFLIMALSMTVARTAQIVGVTVTPHVVAPTLRYSPPRDSRLAARVQLFVQGPAMPLRFDGKTPSELLQSEEWAWHDLYTAVRVPKGALTVWTFNGKSSAWGTGRRFTLEAEGLPRQTIAIDAPRCWISALTFLSSSDAVEPDTLIAHLVNQTRRPITVSAVRLYLPRDTQTWHTLWPQEPMPVAVTIPAGDRGYIRLHTGSLPLTYAVVEITTSAGVLRAHQRIKREVFDISGGWVGDHVRHEAFLHLLAHLHVNTAHIGMTPGYTDNPALYNRLPLKLFHRLVPITTFDTDVWLPRIHAVEFLGEPQYGGGRPVPPQEVFDALLPYRASRLPTTVTHSEERIWRWYAGLSDYPHYDAYRVVAPAADVWALYDRWNGRRIRWGAPLETIGDLCRSLRELNRPMPCAYWSQGPHHGWTDDDRDGRKRRTPTPDELRAQALHALSTRITSLYWFNLSLKSLMAFPDTWPAIQRIGREIRTLDTLFLEGDAYRFERRRRPDGTLDWDLASIVAPGAALLFALDTAY
ncbi:MAG: hypothetical protein NZ557_16230, partial [Chthonomonadaceae bacterium]|nr:hypothetical protein [Chthonomonadaceae bacterium]